MIKDWHVISRWGCNVDVFPLWWTRSSRRRSGVTRYARKHWILKQKLPSDSRATSGHFLALGQVFSWGLQSTWCQILDLQSVKAWCRGGTFSLISQLCPPTCLFSFRAMSDFFRPPETWSARPRRCRKSFTSPPFSFSLVFFYLKALWARWIVRRE